MSAKLPRCVTGTCQFTNTRLYIRTHARTRAHAHARMHDTRTHSLTHTLSFSPPPLSSFPSPLSLTRANFDNNFARHIFRQLKNFHKRGVRRVVAAPSQKYQRVCDVLTHLPGLWWFFRVVASFER